MRRIALALATALVLALPAPASAAVTPTRDAGAVADSMTSASTAGRITSASFPEIPPQGNPAATATTALGGFPLVPNTYALLSSGDTALAPSPDQANFAGVGNGGPATAARGNALDVTVMRIDLDVPQGVNCLSLGFRFLSEEYPIFVGTDKNDGFVAQLDRSDWSGTGTGIDAPGNFAFDDQGNVITVNTMPVASDGSALASVTAEAANTIYNGATQLLSAAQAVPSAGAHSLYLSIFDQGDSDYDSTVFLDRLMFLTTEPGGCVPGAQNDETPPDVTLGVAGSSADDTTPTLSGTAGDATGDAATVTAKIYAGSGATGTPLQTLTAQRSGTGWAVDAAPLSPGTYTAQAEQADIAGNTGFSNPATFTVTSPPPPPPPAQQVQLTTAASPEPVLNQTVVVGVVGGTVRVKGPDGRFRSLGANEAIPLGSTVDATKGRVRLTSASGPGGATQTAVFYQGMFVVTQTRGSKPITQLALAGKLSCGSTRGRRASTAATRKRVRRLWGDGRGRFRTKGRHGAATVKGTRWLTEDRCDSTLIKVKRGTVVVRDFAKRRSIAVKQGRSYVARPKKKK
jgi:hypothetical protein